MNGWGRTNANKKKPSQNQHSGRAAPGRLIRLISKLLDELYSEIFNGQFASGS